MARYVKDIRFTKTPDALAREISDYLTREGFGQIDASQNIWKKGLGLILGPQYIRYEVRPGVLHLEAWIKFALLPGVYLGEMGIEGVFGMIPKRKLKERVQAIEKLIS